MPLILLSFLAGVLTALAPCVLPIIPVVIGGSIHDDNRKRPYIVIASLFVSIVVFTLLLKGTTLLITIPDSTWRVVSSSIIILFGLSLTFPSLWEKISSTLGLYKRSQQALGGAYKQKGLFGAILLGATLGPVFSSCSPVYLFILSAILPNSFIQGLIYIIAYAVGLCLVLLLVVSLGKKYL